MPAAAPIPGQQYVQQQQQQQQRGFSPLPRRSHINAVQTTRPSLDSRASSLSLLSNSSSAANTPAVARGPYGSGLKNQIYSSLPHEAEDPLEALAKVVQTITDITGAKGEDQDQDDTQGEESPKPPELVQVIDFSGLSLQEFARQDVSRLPHLTSPVQKSNESSVAEYEKERDKFENLHTTIQYCDDVLKSVETYLSSFQADLGRVAAEIETLQTKSTALNDKLENRRNAEKVLGSVVNRISIPPGVVKKLSDGPIDEAWIAALQELQVHEKEVADIDKDDIDFKAMADLKPLLENMSNKAVGRIRDYFAGQIKAIRSPNINAQIVQQNGFLKFKALYAYLAMKHPQLAEDLNRAYLNTMKWYYSTHFTRYSDALKKLKIYTIDKADVIGDDSTPSKSSKSKDTMHAPDPMSVGRRGDALKSISSMAIPSHAAEESKGFHYLETPVLAMNLALADNVTYEYSFFTTFFAPLQPSQRQTASLHQRLQSMLAPAIALARDLTSSLITGTYDAIGILLCIRLVQHFAFVAQRRKIPTLESYINSTNMLLWPRFQILLDGHCESLRKATASLPSRNASAASNAIASLSTGGASGVGTLSGVSTAPHPITQRFANFVHGILSISSEAGDDEPVSNSLARLRSEYESFLTKMGNQFGGGQRGKRDRDRFLTNNYMLILTILSDVHGRLADDCKEHFETLKGSVNVAE